MNRSISCVVVAWFPVAAIAQTATFQPLGVFSGGAVSDANSQATGVSSDGSVISGFARGRDAAHQLAVTVALYKSGAAAWQTVPNAGYSVANGVSANGQTLAGTGPVDLNTGTFGPFVFSVGGQPTFPSLANATFLGISGDGSVAVGAMGGHAITWTSGGGAHDLGRIAGWNGAIATATAANSDGTVVVGWDSTGQDPQAFRWTSAGIEGLGFLNTTNQASEALGVSADGSTVVGRSKNASGVYQGFVWRAGQGMLPLPFLSGATGGAINAVSEDGSVLVGESDAGTTTTAYYWDRARGRRDLKQLLTTLGATGLTGWTLRSATAISPNGAFIVGDGVDPQGRMQAWMAHIPAFCYANCDGSSGAPVLNVSDFVCFQSRFAAGDAYANCDQSTAAPVLNVADFVCFQVKFVGGCQ